MRGPVCRAVAVVMVQLLWSLPVAGRGQPNVSDAAKDGAAVPTEAKSPTPPPDPAAAPAAAPAVTPEPEAEAPRRPPRPTVTGAIDRDLIRKTIAESSSQTRYCYQSRFWQGGGPSGWVTVRWIIQADGRPSAVEVDEEASTLGDPELLQCLVGRILHWRFPRPKGGGSAAVTYSWSFAPDQWE